MTKVSRETQQRKTFENVPGISGMCLVHKEIPDLSLFSFIFRRQKIENLKFSKFIQDIICRSKFTISEPKSQFYIIFRIQNRQFRQKVFWAIPDSGSICVASYIHNLISAQTSFAFFILSASLKTSSQNPLLAFSFCDQYYSIILLFWRI